MFGKTLCVESIRRIKKGRKEKIVLKNGLKVN